MTINSELETILRNIFHFETELGSKYYYLDDLRTRRYKSFTGKWSDPNDVIAFIPDYEWYSRNKSKLINCNFSLDWFNSQINLNDEILDYIYKGKLYIIDSDGNIIKHNNDVVNLPYIKQILLSFGSKEKPDHFLLVGKQPRLGYSPIDMRQFMKDGVPIRKRHLGHKIIAIHYKDGIVEKL